MAGFYNVMPDQENPGKTQMRIAYVKQPKIMEIVPKLFAETFRKYESQRA